MCDFDSPRFQVQDDMGYCFDVLRQTPEWKEKVLENVKNLNGDCYDSYQSAATIEEKFLVLLDAVDIWDPPCNSGGTEYTFLWFQEYKYWASETFKRAKDFLLRFEEYHSLPDEEHHVRMIDYLLKIEGIWM